MNEEREKQLKEELTNEEYVSYMEEQQEETKYNILQEINRFGMVRVI